MKLEPAKLHFFANCDLKQHVTHLSPPSRPNNVLHPTSFARARELSGGLVMQHIVVHPFFCKLQPLKSSIFHQLSFQKTHSLFLPSLALNMSLSIASPALLIHLDGGEGMQRTNGNPFFCKLQPLKKRQFSQNMISKHMLISSLSLTKHMPTNCSRPRYWTIWRIGKALNCRESFCCLHALHLCVGCRWSFQPH